MKDTKEFLKTFGLKLKSHRKALGFSQVNAAHQMKIDYRHYQNIEGGKINLRLDTFMKLIEFYQMNQKDGPFDVDTCIGLFSDIERQSPPNLVKEYGVQGEAPSPEGWSALYHDFVESGQAGFISVNCQTGLIDQINEKLVLILGFRTPGQLINKGLEQIFTQQSSKQLKLILNERSPSKISEPFMVTLKAQAPANPIPMMALARRQKDFSSGEEHFHLMVLDRKILGGESKKVRSLLVGNQNELIVPQMHT